MPIRLEVIGDNPAEFTTNLGGVLALSFPRVAAAAGAAVGVNVTSHNQTGGVTAAETVIEPEQVGETTAAKKRRLKAAAEKPVEAETVVDEKAPAPPSQGDVKEKLLALLDAKGDDAPVTVLKAFGVAKISELKADQYAAVIAATEAALKA